MAERERMLELADRCEAATEGDAEIVREVSTALSAEVQWVRIGSDYRRAMLAVIDRSGAAPSSRSAAAALRARATPPETKDGPNNREKQG